MIQDLRAKLGNVYADYADPDTGELTYTQLHKSGTDARLLEEIAAHVSSVTEQEAKLIKETVEQTYTNCYSGMIQAVESAVDDDSLAAAFASVSAAKPQALKAAVDNPVHGLTLSSQLEKNRADIVYTIKQTVGVGLSMGDRYDTMARRIQQSLIGDKKKAGGSYAKAIRIARTEAHRYREQGNFDAAVSLNEKLEPAGVTMMKTWHTMKDNRVRPQHRYKTKSGWKYSKKGKYNHEKMEGVSVPINEKFKLPSGAEADAPGKSGVAGEDINCRCFLSYTVERTEIKRKGAGEDVSEEYLKSAMPGEGNIICGNGYEESIHRNEIKTAEWLHDNMGGDIELLTEATQIGVKTPDYRWRGKYWELKNTTTEKSANSALRSALKQIKDNPGGVIFDYGSNKINKNILLSVIEKRLKAYGSYNFDILVLQNDKFECAYRYKK